MQKEQELGETEYLSFRIWRDLEGFWEEVLSECVLNKRDGCKDVNFTKNLRFSHSYFVCANLNKSSQIYRVV